MLLTEECGRDDDIPFIGSDQCKILESCLVSCQKPEKSVDQPDQIIDLTMIREIIYDSGLASARNVLKAKTGDDDDGLCLKEVGHG